MNDKSIPDILLERYLLGELDPQNMKEIESELKKNPQLQKRLEDLRESNMEILSSYDPARMASAIQNKIEKTGLQEKTQLKKKPLRNKRSWNISPWAMGALGTLGMIAVILSLLPEYSLRYRTFLEIEETRLKGNTVKLFIYRKSDNQIELLTNQSQARENDLIQIGYFTERERFGMIFSIDGRGNVTLHYPENSPESELLTSNQKILLDNSYELDDAPFYETFYFVTSPKKFNVTKTIQSMQEVIELQKKAEPGKKEFVFETSADVVSVRLDKVK